MKVRSICVTTTQYSAILNEGFTFSGNISFCKGVLMQQTSQCGTNNMCGSKKFCQRGSKFDNIFFVVSKFDNVFF